MFELEYKGGNTVVITTKKSKLITDPKQSVVGLKDVEPKGMVSLATEERFVVHSDDAVLEVDGPGEDVQDFDREDQKGQREEIVLDIELAHGVGLGHQAALVAVFFRGIALAGPEEPGPGNRQGREDDCKEPHDAQGAPGKLLCHS